jgi:hypothetical protein
MFVRRAGNGHGAVKATGVTAVLELAGRDTPRAELRAFGIEMGYVAEGPFCLGSGLGGKFNEFHVYVPPDPNRPESEPEDPPPPYIVKSAAAVPTGTQPGKLWAHALFPEDNGEIPAAFPNGYAAFYCMKRPFIRQADYAGFLNTLTEEQVKERWYARGQGHAIKRNGRAGHDTYSATAPDGRTPWLSWEDCALWTAWAGLRPMTELEYEKAIRGPIYPRRGGAAVSYWGLSRFNHGELYERVVSAGSPRGRRFRGTHGDGTAELPADWPSVADGVIYRGDFLKMRPYGPGHLCTSGRLHSNLAHADRRAGDDPYAGWRVVRTAPTGNPATKPVRAGLDLPKRSLPRHDRKVTVDGKPDELGKPLVTLDDAAFVFPLQQRFQPQGAWQGPADLSADVYLGWDGEALAVAVEVTDDRHANTKAGADISSGDAVQIGLLGAKGVPWYMALALTDKGVVFYQYEGDGHELLKTVDCAVVRDDKDTLTRYELRMPLATIGLEPGDEFGFNLMIFDGDDEQGQSRWLQMAPGVDHPVRPSLYPRFVLGE